ncbi:hypothetical protein I302_107258 [Kwoniella bestiolae CBS 10118]|uniref:Uncharacterized protein n=1 Tax=Kwoniella bestiolae CBS 10118 TaxID=1296100 RepID=A0A1B9FZ34_9TREE|nr:hypothetical protein I302_07006 [Kwoniella bestiolae CBS 10118]OCF24020.1 hypothetical protein I302_07006 [Kwoniella bestiolae CBS 10118]
MTHLYDRKTPRQLTIPELWASWNIMIDQPSREAKLVQGTLDRDTLPTFAFNHENIHSGKTPSIYPIIRTDHDKQSDDTLIKLHNHRSLRLLVIRDIFLLVGDEQGDLPPFMRRKTLKELWEMYHGSDREDMPLGKKLMYAEAAKEVANEHSQDGERMEALDKYKTGWSARLPYHLDAFPAGHIARMQLAKMECKIFNNIMATILEMIKANETRYPKAKKIKLLDIGYRAGVSILGICFAMDVGSLQTTLRRIAQIKSKLDILDTARTCAMPSKEFRKLHDDLIKYCKDRDPDEKLLQFEYKSQDTKMSPVDVLLMMRFMEMGMDMDM